jgi:hypothetical protein
MLSMFVASPDFKLAENGRKAECPLLRFLVAEVAASLDV